MKTKKILMFLCVMVFVLSLFGCSKATFKISEDNITIKIGQTYDLSVDVKDATWVSTDSTVATVDNGTVTGLKEGTAVIKAIYKDKTISCNVTVENAYYPVLKIENKTATLFLGEAYGMSAICMVGDEEVDVELQWTSSDEKVATIDKEGNLKTIAKGKTTISASAEYDGIYVDDAVEVIITGLNYIDAAASIEMGLYAGDSVYTVDYTVYIDGVPVEEKVEITSKDTSIASVDETGKLKAVSEGETVITLQYNSDKDTMSLEIPVTVKRHIIHTFSVANECYYVGDIVRNKAKTIGEHWTVAKPKVTTDFNLEGKNGTGCPVWAYHYDPAVSFPMELSKRQLQSYQKAGYSSVVIPVYTSGDYAANIQIECAGYLSPKLPADEKWKEVEIPLNAFIADYDSYAVKGTPIIFFKNCQSVYPENVGGKEVGFNIYLGDIYVR